MLTRRSFFMTALAPLLLRVAPVDVSQIANTVKVSAFDPVTGIVIHFVTRDTKLRPGRTIEVVLPHGRPLNFVGTVQRVEYSYD